MKTKYLAIIAVSILSTISLTSCVSTNLWKTMGKVTMVITSPDDAKVYDGQTNTYLGKTPVKIMLNVEAVKAGIARLKFEKEGYQTFEYTVPTDFKGSELKIRLHPINERQERVSRDNAGATEMEKSIIRWNIDSDPRGARVYYRVISSVPSEVKNTNETYLGTTPYEETRGFNILGLTYDNSNDVTIEIKITKRGYEDQVKRFNARMAIDQQEISGFFELVEKD